MSQERLLDKLFEPGKVFTASNWMSMLRLIGSFPLYYLTLHKMIPEVLGLTVFLIFTDFADGYLARRFGQVSELGKVLDPLADKFCAAFSFLALYQAYGLPFWILAVIIGRDLLILLGSAYLITRLPYVTPSKMAGKIAVTLVAALYLVYLLDVEALKFPLEISALVMIGASSAQYAYVFWQNSLKPQQSGTDEPTRMD